MIRIEFKNGSQKITAVCDKCKCHIKDLTITDILVKGKTDAIVKDENGKEITRKDHQYNKCECEHCCED
tara:strand:+ start:858 stop:1064 length:207 start_codon:yes stop_codon:yes gene_type:complete